LKGRLEWLTTICIARDVPGTKKKIRGKGQCRMGQEMQQRRQEKIVIGKPAVLEGVGGALSTK